MKNLLTIIVLLLGVTIYFDMDSGTGCIWVNNDASADYSTVIVQPSLNAVTMYSSDGAVDKITFEQFCSLYGKNAIDSIKNAPIVIHKKNVGKEAPGIKY